MPTIRTFQRLLPNAKAWRFVVDKTLRRFFEGLVGNFSDARTFIDEVYLDLFPETTRELAAWEHQFGIQAETTTTEANRRAALAAEWAATGGQSPSYIQGVLQAAGFDVYIHEWWSSGPSPYVARDPRDYTEVPLVGTVQCSAFADQPQCVATGLAPVSPSGFSSSPTGPLLNRQDDDALFMNVQSTATVQVIVHFRSTPVVFQQGLPR